MAAHRDSFARFFDELAGRPNDQWSDNASLARFIRKRVPALEHLTPDRVSRWRRGAAVPHPALQGTLLALLEKVTGQRSRGRRAG